MGAGGSKEREGVDISLLEEIPEHIRGRVEKQFREQINVIEELQTKHEKFKVNSEQKYFELEKELIETQGDLNVQTGLASELKEQVADLEKKYGQTSQQLRELQQQEHEHGRQTDELSRAKLLLESEKRDLSDLVDKKNKEIDRLQEEWQQMSLRVSEANKEKIEAIAKKDETLSEFVKVEHQTSRMKQEKEILNQQVVWLEAQLKEKSGELLNIRKENSSQLLELQANLDIKEGELQHTQEQLQHAKETGEKLVESNEKYINKLEDLTNVQTFREEQFRSQLQTQEKLIGLYKKSSSEAEERCKELETGAEEVQKLLAEAIKAKEEIEELRRDDSTRFDKVVQNKDKSIGRLETELKNANELLEAAKQKGMLALSEENVEALSPAAAAASKLLKSGMTLTQIYSEYVQASEKLVFEEQENKRLTQCLESIMSEIEEKAPILKKQREDYENAMETVDLLSKQLDSAVTETDRKQIQVDETNRQFAEVSRENYRLKQQSLDLGTQVRMLLKELEQARGTVVMHRDDVPADESPAQQVISQKLVTFRSIEELQEQNQKLLGVVRELSEQQERDEQSNVDAKTAELTKRLQSAMEEMDEMRASRERQVHLTEAIVRQRDMYKALLADSQNEAQLSAAEQQKQESLPTSGLQTPGPVAAPVTPKSTSKSPSSSADKSLLLETKSALRDLQEEFNTYRKEKAENEKLLNEQIDRLREQGSEHRVNNAKLTTQLSYAEERYKTVHSNIEKYKLEIAALTNMNSKYSGSVVKHEQTIAMLREDMMATQEKLTRAEVQVVGLQQQCESLRAMEARVSQEKESVLREQRSQNLLLANIQAIQNNLERSDFETKTMLKNRIEQLEKENVLVKRKLDQAQDQRLSYVQSLEKQLTETRNLLAEVEKSDRRKTTELKQAWEQVQHLASQVTTLEAQLTEAKAKRAEQEEPQHVLSTQAAVNAGQLRDLKQQLQQAKTQISDLEEQLAKSRKHAEQYKSIADTIEKNLAYSTKASKELQEKLEGQVKDSQEKLEEVQEQLDRSDAEKQQLINDNMRLASEIKSSSTDLRAKLESLQSEYQEAVQRRETAILTEQKAITDLEEQVQRANDAQDKYQRELMLHAADVTSLTKVKDELEGFSTKLTRAEESAKEASEKLAMEKVGWEEQKKLAAEERSRLQARVSELQQQNDVLHENLDQLSKQMLGLQNRKGEEERATAQLAERVAKQPQDKSAEQLLEVIKFLRREKDIASTRLEVVQAESTRYKHQSENLEKQLQEAREAIQSEREKAQVSVQTAAQHSDLLRKVENLNILQESNRMMREEKDSLGRQVRELEAKVSQLESDIQPLQASKRELGAQRDTLTADCETLKGEIERWKARTNRLIEERIDPHEHKKAVEDLAETRSKLAASQEDNGKNKAELSLVNKQLSESKTEANSANIKVKSLSEQLEKLKSEGQQKDKDIEEKNRTLNQLRNIGRKYRKQAEDTQKEIDSLKKQYEETLKINVPEIQEKLKTAEERVKALEEQLKVSDESVKSLEAAGKAKTERANALETERNEALRKLGTSEMEKTDLLKKIIDLETKAKQSAEQHQKVTEELKQSKATEAKLKAEDEEKERQKEIHRKLMVGAKTKVNIQKAEIEQLKKENEELKTKMAGISQSTDESDQRLKAVKSQYEIQVTRLRAELETTRGMQQDAEKLKQELDGANKKVTELTHRINQLQKLVEVYKSQISVSSTAQKAAASSAPTEPKTANIRPMTAVTAPTSTTQVRMQQAQPIQPVRSASSETRAMASIRPMAVSTVGQAVTMAAATAAAGAASQTPTATVHPTTQEWEATQPLHVATQASTSSSSSSSGGRPTQPVQPVSPHVEESREQPSVSDDSSSHGNQEPSSTSPAMSVAPSTSVSSSTPVTQPPTQEVAPSTSLGVGATPSTSLGVGSSGVFGTKRPREEEDGQASPQTEQEQGPVKKTKTLTQTSPGGEVSQSEEQTEASSMQSVPGTSLEPSHADMESADAETTAETSQDVSQLSENVVGPSDTSSQTVEASGQDDVIIVDEGEGVQGDEVEEGDEGMVEAGEPYEDYEEEGEEYYTVYVKDDDDDVVIVEDDGDLQPSSQSATLPSQPSQQQQQQQQRAENQQLEAQSSSSTVGSQLSSSSSADSNRLGSAAGFGCGDRLAPAGARTQLQPFSFANEAQVDLGDDGIVPSTPTLFVPKRSDGFAEAVSSPQVSRQFVFSGAAEASQPDFGQLATHGGLDNPFIDLAQLEHQQSTQSSVTSSVLGVQQGVTPLIAVTEAGEQEVVGRSSGAASGEAASTETSLTQQQVVGSTSSTDNSGSQQASSSDEQTAAPLAGQSPGQGQLGQGEGSTTGEASARLAQHEKTDAQEKSDASDAQKPKIEPIVWGDPSTSSTPPSQAPRQASSTQRFQPGQPAQQSFPQQLGQPIGTIGSPQYQQQQGQKRFPSHHAARRAHVASRSRPTAFRSRRPFAARGPSHGQVVHQPNVAQQQGMQRGVRGGRVAKRGPYRQAPF